jgi:8-hydroxy-5-deazaflavin:NADPH oxidoreductase
MSVVQHQPAEARTIGILGAGRVGTAVARQALKAGYDVKIATSKLADEIALLVEIITPGAVAVTAAEAAAADIVVVAVPLHKYRTLDPDLLAGRTVIDAMNYWAPIDGEIDDFENDERTSSEIVQAYLSGSDIVKTLNHIGYHDLEVDGRLPGSEDRRALALAGGSDDAKALVAGFIDRLGYDTVDAGPLESGRAFQPGTEIFNGSHSATQLRAVLAADREPARA